MLPIINDKLNYPPDDGESLKTLEQENDVGGRPKEKVNRRLGW